MNCRGMKTSPLTRIPAVWASIAGCLLAMLISGCRVESPPPSTTPPPSTKSSELTAEQPSSSDTAETKTETVTLEIFKPDGEKNADKSKTPAADFSKTIDVTTGTSLEEVMRQLDQPEIVITGSGVTAFVQSIDGVASDSSRGWTFTIDGEFSNVGIGSVKLTPPQTIRWRLTTLEEATQQAR